MTHGRTYVDGEGLEVRLDAANRLLDDERDRELSLNTRAIAVGVAAAVVMGLAARPIESVLSYHHSPSARIALEVASGLLIALFITTLAVVIFGVLKPSARGMLSDKTMLAWLEDPGMEDSEQAARYEILSVTVDATLSRRDVNGRKAKWLGVAYWTLSCEPIPALVLIVTLAGR